jgi:hypothetical protein
LGGAEYEFSGKIDMQYEVPVVVGIGRRDRGVKAIRANV